MNEKEAREIVALHKAEKCEECFEGECQDQALGYLEAREKARGLEEALENFLIGYDLGQFKIIYKEPAPTKGIVPIFKEALAKFRGAI